MYKAKIKDLESLNKFLQMLRDMNPLTSFTFNSLATDWGKKLGYHIPYITLVPIELVRMGLLNRERVKGRYFYCITDKLKTLSDSNLSKFVSSLIYACKKYHRANKTANRHTPKPTESPKVLKADSTLDLLKSKNGYIMLGDYIITGDNITVWKKLS